MGVISNVWYELFSKKNTICICSIFDSPKKYFLLKKKSSIDPRVLQGP